MTSCVFFNLLLIFAPLSLLFPSLGHAEDPVQNQESPTTDSSARSLGISFYRSPLSLFASGQSGLAELESTMKRTQLEYNYIVTNGSLKTKIPSSLILRDIQLSYKGFLKERASLKSEAYAESADLAGLPPKTPFEIQLIEGAWAKIIVNQVGPQKAYLVGWIPLHLLSPAFEDLGFGVTLIDSFLKKTPQLNGELITTIPRNKRVTVLNYQNTWALIKYDQWQGYVDINHLILKADFAYSALDEKNQWHPILYRENDQLITQQNKKLSLAKIRGLATQENLGIVINAQPPDFTLRNRLKINETLNQYWVLSTLPNHGDVWWQKTPKVALTTQLTSIKGMLTTEELLRKNIFSIAFLKDKTLSGFASARGIYKTDDALNWEPIPLFGTQDYPITIGENGLIWIGPYRSLDNGKTFEQQIKWDQLTRVVQGQLTIAPSFLKLNELEIINKQNIKLSVDTGYQHLQVLGNPESNQWKVLRLKR
jgi:hypothetical protein